MKSPILRNLMTIVPFALAGCAGGGGGQPATASTAPQGALTRVGAAVQVTDSGARARECEFVADIPLRSTDPANADGMIALRNDAGAAGANLVLLVMETRTVIERAEGYLCADE